MCRKTTTLEDQCLSLCLLVSTAEGSVRVHTVQRNERGVRTLARSASSASELAGILSCMIHSPVGSRSGAVSSRASTSPKRLSNQPSSKSRPSCWEGVSICSSGTAALEEEQKRKYVLEHRLGLSTITTLLAVEILSSAEPFPRKSNRWRPPRYVLNDRVFSVKSRRVTY